MANPSSGPDAEMRNRLAMLERAIELRRRSAEQLAQRAAVLLSASGLLLGLLSANPPASIDPTWRRVIAIVALLSLVLSLALGIAAVFPRKLVDDDLNAVQGTGISLAEVIERRDSELTTDARMAKTIRSRRFLLRVEALTLGLGGALTVVLAVTAIAGV